MTKIVDSTKYSTLNEEKQDTDQVACEDDQGNQISSNDLQYLLADKTWKDAFVKIEDPEKIITRLVDLGYANPSKIQSKTIPFALTSKSVGVLAQSHNGSGKTLAFLIPSILRVDLSKPLRKTQTIYMPQVIILAPTSELCSQIVQVGQSIAQIYPDLKVSSGRDEAHVIVKTPGGLMQAIAKKQIDLSNVNLFVVDEADGQLKGESGMNLNQGISKLPKGTGLFFFSATYTQEAIDYINLFFKKLELKLVLRYLLKAEELRLDGIHQFSRRCDSSKKIDYIDKLMKSLETDMQIIIFVNTKKFAEIVFKELQNRGHPVGLLIGGQLPQERTAILNSFREGKFKILITTNLLARGFDQRTIGLVINFDIPRHYGDAAQKGLKADLETYLHRIGRTGRFGDVGLAINLYNVDSEREMLADIEKKYEVKIEDLSKETEQKEFDKINDYLDQVAKINKEKQAEQHEKIKK